MQVAHVRSAARAHGATALVIDDEQYPPLLREIHDPPPVLYARGNLALLSEAQLAVIGSRRASSAGLRITAMLAEQLVQAGLHICSGLAQGIDGAAHRGALHAGGHTVAVMASGIDRVYPRCHQGLAGQVGKVGCLVTEFPPGMPPLRQNFPQRNRIISGLSLGALVVEAALPSGSMITARMAMEQGREVFALPWSVLHLGGKGCLQLLRDGAKMVQGVNDILEELGPLYALQCALTEQPAIPLGPAAQTSWLLPLVGFEAVSLDALVRSSARPVAQVMAELCALQLAGHLTRTAGGYVRC